MYIIYIHTIIRIICICIDIYIYITYSYICITYINVRIQCTNFNDHTDTSNKLVFHTRTIKSSPYPRKTKGWIQNHPKSTRFHSVLLFFKVPEVRFISFRHRRLMETKLGDSPRMVCYRVLCIRVWSVWYRIDVH